FYNLGVTFMNIRYRNFLLYLIVVIVPTLIGSLYHIHNVIEQDDQKRLEETKWIAAVHLKNWDQFISETVTTLDILALTAETAVQSQGNLEPLLQRTYMMDPRYGGIYLLDRSGKVIIGSNHHLQEASLSNLEYIQEVMKTKNIVISD